VGSLEEAFLPERIELPFADHLSRALESGTTANGVFGARLQWNYFGEFLSLLRAHLSREQGTDLAVIETLFPAPGFVWMRRLDTVAQGVSWARAAQTGQYAAFQEATGEPVFDFRFIDGLVQLARTQTEAWRAWFAAQGVAPSEVTYEVLCADLKGTTLESLSFLGLEPLEDRTIGPPPWLTRQADAISHEWISRYRQLAAD
jgi:trehalose 2-sulfotransferase